jgi:hypothetical protein
VVRAVIQGNLGRVERTITGDATSTPVDGFWPATCLLLGAIYLMAGWSLGLDFIVLLVVISALYNMRTVARRGRDDAGLTLGIYLAVLGAWFVAITVFMLSNDTIDLNAGLAFVIGFVLTEAIDSGQINDRSQEVRNRMLHAIARAMPFRRASDDLPSQFEGQWPFKSESDQSVWAIDPEHRAVRRMLPLGHPDVVVPWDEPIRSIELRRLRRLLPIVGCSYKLIRGDRELVVTSGADKRGAWTHIFHFSGDDKALALRWRDTFEAWMRDDQRAAAAKASAH